MKKTLRITKIFLLVGAFAMAFTLQAQTNQWTWMAGPNSTNQAGTYGTKGIASSSNIPGARKNSAHWTDASGNFWMYGGNGYDKNGSLGVLSDLWKYDGTNWTWVSGDDIINQTAVYGTKGTAAASNKPGQIYSPASWIDGSGDLWMFGGGNSISSRSQVINALWKFDVGTSQWTWVSGTNGNNGAATYGTKGVAASSNVPLATKSAAYFKDNSGNFYFWGGSGPSRVFLNHLWKWDGTNWTWVSGGTPSYGTKGLAANSNMPEEATGASGWADANGDLWIFGGFTGGQWINSLWKYDVSASQWIWVKGSANVFAPGVYGTKGVAAGTNTPGSRNGAGSWVDGYGNAFVFGGYLSNNVSAAGSDLWKWDGINWTWVSGAQGGNNSPIYGTKGVSASSNQPGSRHSPITFANDSGLWLFGGVFRAGRIPVRNDLWRYAVPVTTANNCVASTILSDGDGDWETPSTWVGGVVPDECDSVIIRHEVDVTATTGKVKIAGLTLDNSIKPTMLTIASGDSFIVTGGASVITGNSTKNNEMIVDNGSKLVINHNLVYSRSSANNRTTDFRLVLDAGSQVDCNNFIFNNLGLNTETVDEIVLNASTLNIAGDFTVMHDDGEDFTIVMDSSTLKVGGDVSLTRSIDTRDLNITLGGTSLFEVAGDMEVTLLGGRSSFFTGNNESKFDIKGSFTQTDTSFIGRDNSIILNNTATMEVGESLSISNDATLANALVIVNDNGALTVEEDVVLTNLRGISTELETNDNGAAVIKRNLSMDAQASGKVRVDLNNRSNLSLGGNVIRTNNLGASQMDQGATMTYNGTNTQILTSYDLGAGDLFSHTNVVIDNSIAIGMEVGAGGAWITDTMTFLTGRIFSTNADHPIFVGPRAFTIGASDASHVNGPVRKDGAGGFTFPTGKWGFLGQIGISDPGVGGDFTAVYFRTEPPFATDLAVNLENISKSEHWYLNRDISSSSSVYVTLHWQNAYTSGIDSLPELRVAHYTGGLWQNEFQSATTGAAGYNSGSVVSSGPISTFSPFTFGSNSISVNPLPVELIDFTAVKLDATTAKVSWSTASEDNAAYFEVERSLDGKVFESIGTVEAKGNSSELSDYAYIDADLRTLHSEVVFYRLNAVDFDAKSSKTRIVALALDKAIDGGKLLTGLTPNPFRNTISINLNTEITTPVEVMVSDVLGRVKFRSTIDGSQGIAHNLDLSTLPNGVYTISILSNGKRESYKTIKY